MFPLGTVPKAQRLEQHITSGSLDPQLGTVQRIQVKTNTRGNVSISEARLGRGLRGFFWSSTAVLLHKSIGVLETAQHCCLPAAQKCRAASQSLQLPVRQRPESFQTTALLCLCFCTAFSVEALEGRTCAPPQSLNMLEPKKILTCVPFVLEHP